MCFKMTPSQDSNRINLQDLKSKITKKLGPGRASQYFQILGQFFSCKLSKAELDRQVLLTLEKDYLALHNQLIWSIWANATLNGAAPSPILDKITKSNLLQKKSPPVTTIDHESSPQVSQSPGQAAWSNGCVVAVSPRKGRTSKSDRKAKERQNVSTIYPREVSTSREAVIDDHRGKGLEDGVVEAAEFSKRLEETQDSAQQLQSDQSSPSVPHAKKPRLVSSNGVSYLQAQGADKRSSNLGLESIEQVIKDETSCISAKTLIAAPLGIPFCVGSIGAAAKVPILDRPLPLNYTLLGDKLDEDWSASPDLPDTDSLQRRMEHIAVLEGGLEGVSRESAICLNQALDVYLKQLIAACTEFVQSRRLRDSQGNAPLREKETKRNEPFPSVRLSPGLNGIQPSHQPPKSAAVPLEAAEEENFSSPITPIDFKVVMENKPQQLGENWPVLLERISFRVFEQQDKQYLSGL